MIGRVGVSQRVARVLTLPLARAHAVMVILIFCAVYAYGIAHRHGLIDGFGHVIGSDLLHFRTAAQIVRDGRGTQLYDFSLQYALQQSAVRPESLAGVDPFIAPPFVALFYVPWALLPQPIAFVAWTALCLACLVATLLLMRRCAWRTGARWPSSFLISLSFYPVLEALAAGTNALLSPLIFAGAYLALKRERDTVAGAVLGLQLYRPQLLLAPLLLLVFKRRWRALAGFAGVALALAGLATVLVDRGALIAWLRIMPLASRMFFEKGIPSSIFGSLYAVFLLPLGPEHFALGMVAGTVASLAVLVVLLRSWTGPWRPDEASFDLRFAALLVVTPLVSQYLSLHDLAILIIPALLATEYWLAHGAGAGWVRLRITLAGLWLACLVGPPLVSRVVRLPIAPLAALLFGWVVLDTLRAERQAGG
jgi:hypothetical protein